MTTWLTAHQAAEHVSAARRLLSASYAGCTERTIRSWVARRHLTATGQDADGLQLFTLADVARAERATRADALRQVGISDHAPPRIDDQACICADHTTALTLAEAAAQAGRCRQAASRGRASVQPDAIGKWVRRGHLHPSGHDDDGRQLFTAADVARAERATRARALRLVGIGANT